eukprot:g9708.t1
MHGSKVVLTDLRDHRLSAASLEPAEIAFGGPFIARGYLGRPDLDAKAFVPDFTASEPSEATDSTTLTGSTIGSTPMSIENCED